MKQSLTFIPTLREAPKEAEIASHKLLLRAGFIKQIAAGVYTYLPLGLRVLRKIESIIREELEAIGCSELLMPAMQPAELWKESGRWDDYGQTMMRMKDRHDRDFALGPTHEEVITYVIRDYLNSYKKMPLALYQIQTKFRDELRPRFGLMRGREFVMKDAYSFHTNEESLDEWYQNFKQAYINIFDRCKLEFRMVDADNGDMGGSESTEFMVLNKIGEDTIVYSDSSDFASNIEVHNLEEGAKSPDGNGTIKHAKGIEVGHVFKLGAKYSEKMNAMFINENQKRHPVLMGCYGIGVSRVMMAIIEQYNDENGIVWPKELAPFDVHLICIDPRKDEQSQAAEKLYNEFMKNKIDVLYDDRRERPGVKFSDADLIGIPVRITVGRGIKDGKVEVKYRNRDEVIEVDIDEVKNNL
ncbi:proline--tRNA ligase [Haloplasma contractile]|uniref:Proline--tRNA ligase n=1 Tax=Haloplasma contractile SSD-17B TaxID=1033810 RepID=U2DZ18_9MOLU|nr:proline--tRNA ligase [Haloplasma contractile]ERJ13477.1 Proline--tRNA ligase 1 protein [Haloplasma contractile SSD-17B]